MPRNSANNPTERILRLLDDYDELSNHYDEVMQRLATHDPAFFKSLSAKPSAVATIQERERQQILGSTTRATRRHMQRLRSNPGRQAAGPVIHSSLTPDLTIEGPAMEPPPAEAVQPEDLEAGLTLGVKK